MSLAKRCVSDIRSEKGASLPRDPDDSSVVLIPASPPIHYIAESPFVNVSSLHGSLSPGGQILEDEFIDEDWVEVEQAFTNPSDCDCANLDVTFDARMGIDRGSIPLTMEQIHVKGVFDYSFDGGTTWDRIRTLRVEERFYDQPGFSGEWFETDGETQRHWTKMEPGETITVKMRFQRQNNQDYPVTPDGTQVLDNFRSTALAYFTGAVTVTN